MTYSGQNKLIRITSVYYCRQAKLKMHRDDTGAQVLSEAPYLSKFWVLDHCTIAAKLFLEIFKDLAVAELLLQSLDSSQTLATITLLDAYMNVVL